jgi:hypothetical protein
VEEVAHPVREDRVLSLRDVSWDTHQQKTRGQMMGEILTEGHLDALAGIEDNRGVVLDRTRKGYHSRQLKRNDLRCTECLRAGL